MLTLIDESPKPQGVFDDATRTERTVYCTVRSVTYHERYEAASHGLRPELVAKLADTLEYRGERRCELEGTEYTVLHEYLTQDGGVELTLERRGAP